MTSMLDEMIRTAGADEILEPLRETTACICGHEGVDRTLTARDEHTGERFTMARCAECGAERVLDRPTPAEIGDYDGACYASHTVRPRSASDRIKRLVRTTFYGQRRRSPMQAVLRLLFGRYAATA